MDQELEDLAVRIVALPVERRLALEQRVQALGKRVRRVSQRLTGRTGASKLQQLMAGGSIYNEHGEPVAYIQRMNVTDVHRGIGGMTADMTVVER